MGFLAKRIHPRKLLRDGVKIYAPQGVEYATFEDISGGGIRLFMNRSPELGEIFDMELRFPGLRQDTRISAKVVRVNESGRSFEVGLEFLKIDPATEAH